MISFVRKISATRRVIALLSLLAVGACAGYFGEPISEIVANNPKELASMSEDELCFIIKVGEESPKWSIKDKNRAYKILRKRGFSKRDADLISDQGIIYGTQMTFRGLKCTTAGNLAIVNKAFYPYIGHEWQVEVGEFEFVYLRGDGTEKGMRVFAWN